MEKARLSSFSDGVMAIIITIMVLELKVPHGSGWHDLFQQFPLFLSYVLSFIYIAIYWHNHHHMIHLLGTVKGSVLWANSHLLFWLSLVPVTTGWMGESHFSAIPTLVYGVVLLMCALAYYILQNVIIHTEGPQSRLKRVIGKDIKGKASLVMYVIGISCASFSPLVANAIYATVALLWLIPDPRIEKKAV